MKKVLGKKQSTSSESVQRVIDHIGDYITEEEVEKAALETVKDIKRVTKKKKAAYAWSGGKDSIVLADLCKQAGITQSVFAYSNLEYPAFMGWCRENAPEGCDMICTGQDLEWLAKHQKMIFPKDSKTLARWYAIIQQTTYVKYQEDQKLDLIISGHRRIDGNVVGADGYVRRKKGFVRYAPIRDWPHELLYGYIHYHHLSLPPIYGWKDGWRQGTHSWPARCRMESNEQGYREVYEIDHTLIEKAAEYIPEAKAFLDHLGEEAKA